MALPGVYIKCTLSVHWVYLGCTWGVPAAKCMRMHDDIPLSCLMPISPRPRFICMHFRYHKLPCHVLLSFALQRAAIKGKYSLHKDMCNTQHSSPDPCVMIAVGLREMQGRRRGGGSLASTAIFGSSPMLRPCMECL